MPRGDRTGPLGMGPMTGRAAGYCAGYTVPGYINPYGGCGIGFRRGFFRGGGGFGRGRGFGRGFGYAAPFVPGYPVYGKPVAYPGVMVTPAAASADVELNRLKAEAEYLKQNLDQISRRIEELDSLKQEKVE